MAAIFQRTKNFYNWMMEKRDPRVEDWLLMKTPLATSVIFFLYLLVVWQGPKLMKNRQPLKLKWILIPYNFGLVILSFHMFYEFLVTSVLSSYSYICQPVDYSYNPLPMRMARVCWWFFFSKVIELLDTVFFILRKKNEQVTFLHVYHHCSMIINWWLGARFVAGGQSECMNSSENATGLTICIACLYAFFVAMLNSFVHVIMYTYYCLAAFGPHMQKYLWWKRYLTRMQLTQFFAFLVHTSINLVTECDYPKEYCLAVFLYAISLILLFGNFYRKTYSQKSKETKLD